ncbi:MAG: two-component regulator propeller domain-containing protein [Candidatus Kapaibacterium sp.]
MKHHYPRAFFVLLMLGAAAFSQASAQRRGWHNYNDGNLVTSLADAGNTLWIGTQGGGLVKYDKTTQTRTFFDKANSGLGNINILAMEKDAAGNLWIGTDGSGLIKFDGQAPEWNHWIAYANNTTGLPMDRVTAVAVKGKDVWAATFNGLVHYDGTNWSLYNVDNSGLPDNRLTAVSVGTDDAVWVGTFAKGAARMMGDQWTTYRAGTNGYNGDSVTAINANVYGKVWIGAANAQANLFNGATWTTVNLKSAEAPGFNITYRAIYDIEEGGGSDILFGTYAGFVRYNGTPTLVRYPKATQGTADAVHAIVKIDEHNSYTGTQQSGVKVLVADTLGSRIASSRTPLSGNKINAVMVDRNNHAWFTTPSTVASLIDTTFKFYGFGGISGGYLSVAQDSLGYIWYGKSNGLSMIDSSGKSIQMNGAEGLQDLPGLNFPAITVNKGGTVWVANASGVGKYDHGVWTGYNSTNSTIPDGGVISLASDPIGGGVWMGTQSNGLVQFKTGTFTTFNQGNSQIPSSTITSVTVDNAGAVWMGTQGAGLAKFDGTTWTLYNTSNSAIPNDNITSVSADKFGGIWIGTGGRGVAKFDGTKWTSYTTENSGLTDDRVTSVAVGGDRKLWIGTQFGGLVMYDEQLILGTDNGNGALAANTMLEGNAPNPFASATEISFTLGAKSSGSLSVVNARGQVVALLLDGEIEAGAHHLMFDATRLPAGTYFTRLTAGGKVETRMMTLVR